MRRKGRDGVGRGDGRTFHAPRTIRSFQGREGAGGTEATASAVALIRASASSSIWVKAGRAWLERHVHSPHRRITRAFKDPPPLPTHLYV